MGWYVVETKPQAEKHVQKKIAGVIPMPGRPKIPTWLLEIPRTAPAHYRFASPTIIVIRRYVFVQFDPALDDGAWQDINRLDGVKGIIGMAGRTGVPAPISPADFKRLQELAVELMTEAPMVIEQPKPLEKHTVVRILFGAMPMFGKVEFDNGIRADVLVQSAGLASKITLPRELIEAV